MNYSEELYQSYTEDRKDFLDREKHQTWLKEYMEINYRKFCPKETNERYMDFTWKSNCSM